MRSPRTVPSATKKTIGITGPSIAKMGLRPCRKHSKCSLVTSGFEAIFAVLYSWLARMLSSGGKAVRSLEKTEDLRHCTADALSCSTNEHPLPHSFTTPNTALRALPPPTANLSSAILDRIPSRTPTHIALHSALTISSPAGKHLI